MEDGWRPVFWPQALARISHPASLCPDQVGIQLCQITRSAGHVIFSISTEAATQRLKKMLGWNERPLFPHGIPSIFWCHPSILETLWNAFFRSSAFFRHLSFQKCSEREVFCALWLPHVLRATMVCNFSSLIWPDGSAPAALASLLFDPSGATNHWKNTVFRDFPTFSRIWASFFWPFLFSDLLSAALLFSDSSHLCFSICPYCRKFDF